MATIIWHLLDATARFDSLIVAPFVLIRPRARPPSESN